MFRVDGVRQSGHDVVTDFRAGGTTDEIRIASSHMTRFDDVMDAAVQNGSDTTIDFGHDNVLILRGVEVADLRASDFLFGTV